MLKNLLKFWKTVQKPKKIWNNRKKEFKIPKNRKEFLQTFKKR